MATYDVAAGELGVHAITLTANDECLVRFAEDVSTIEILNMDGIAPLYFVVNGKKAAIVAGRHTRVIPASVASVSYQPWGTQPTTVSLISSGTPTVSVTRV